MKRLLVATAALALLGGSALAQSGFTPPTQSGVSEPRGNAGMVPVEPLTTGTIAITPEDEMAVSRFVTERRIAPVPDMNTVVIGAEIPGTVELHAVPSVERYRAAVVGGRTVLVDPGTRRVVRIIEAR